MKTYEMVDDASTDSVVSWSSAGASFVVWDPQHFCQHLLPRYFKHSNFSSFIRQLNIYGFRKSNPDRWEFVNESFIRGQRHLLPGIRRRTSAIAGGRPQQMVSSSSSSARETYQQEVRAHLNHVVWQRDAVAQCTTQMQNQLVLAGSNVLPMDIPAGGPHIISDEQGMQEEIEKLRRDKSLLMVEVMRLRQQLQSTEQDLHTMWQRLEAMEQRQHYMLAFVTRAANTSGSQSVLADSMGQLQQPHAQQLASDVGNSERRRPQLMLPSIRGISSPVETNISTGFQANSVEFSPQEKALIRASLRPEEIRDLGNIARSSGNPGLISLHSPDARGHPPQSERTELDARTGAGVDVEKLSHSCRPQLMRFLSHSTRLDQSPSTSAGRSTCLPDQNRPQAPKPILIHREGREISDTLLFNARPELSLGTRAHEYSYQIITREMSIGASFLPRPKHNAESEGLAQGATVGRHETGSASVIEPVEAHGYTHALPRQEGHDAEEIRALQAMRRRTGDHPSAFSFVGRSAQINGQAQFGVVSGSRRRIEQGAGPPLLSEEPQQVEGNSQGLFRLNSIMSESELHLPIPSANNAFEVDSALWELPFSSAHLPPAPEQETSSAAATNCRSSSQPATLPTNITPAAAGSSDHRQEWPWRDSPKAASPPPSTSWQQRRY